MTSPFHIRKHLRIGGMAFVACLSLSSVFADQVVLKNGDKITGSIVKKDGKNLTIKTANFGVVTTAWDQIVSVETDKPLNIVLHDGKTVQGTLKTVDGKVEITTPSAKLSVAPADVVIIRDGDEQKAYDRLQKPGWGELWAGTASVGLAGTSGNAETLTFTTAVNAARVTNTDKTTIYFSTIKASALANGIDADTAQAVRGGIGYDHNLTPRIFANVFNNWEYDKFQDLNLRFVVGGGIGFHAVKTARSKLDLLGGFDFDHASFSTPLTQSFAEVFGGDDYTLKVGKATSLVQGFRIFDDLSDLGGYRANFNVGLSTKVSKWLVWNVSLSDNYLNHPAPGRKTNDFLYTTGLGITFAK